MSLSPDKWKSGISVDGWAVLLSLAAALLVRIGLIKVVPW
jgi:hypothetical protein